MFANQGEGEEEGAMNAGNNFGGPCMVHMQEEVTRVKDEGEISPRLKWVKDA